MSRNAEDASRQQMSWMDWIRENKIMVFIVILFIVGAIWYYQSDSSSGTSSPATPQLSTTPGSGVRVTRMRGGLDWD